MTGGFKEHLADEKNHSTYWYSSHLIIVVCREIIHKTERGRPISFLTKIKKVVWNPHALCACVCVFWGRNYQTGIGDSHVAYGSMLMSHELPNDQ
jgi:hypothetical protein